MYAPRARGYARAVCAEPELPARYRWTPFVAAALLFGLVALKSLRPGEAHGVLGPRRSIMTLCDNPWVLPNALMGLGETGAALALCVRGWRPVGAGLGLLTMSCAALFSLYAGVANVDLSGCGCFGPFDAPWTVHLLMAVTVALPCALALPSVPRPSSTRRCRSARRGARRHRMPSAR